MVGVVAIVTIACSMWCAAYRCRRIAAPQLSGAVARLGEVVAVLGTAIVVSEALGAVGWFRPLPVAVGLLGGSLLVAMPWRSVPGGHDEPRHGSTWWERCVGAATFACTLAWYAPATWIAARAGSA